MRIAAVDSFRHPRYGALSARNLKELLLVFVIALVASGYFYTQDDVNSNSRLAMVKAVVEENRFEIDSYHNGVLKTEDESYFNGHYYTDKAIGSSLIGIEFFSVLHRIGEWFRGLSIEDFKRIMTFLAISLLCAFLAPLLYSFVKQVTWSGRYALLVTVAICIGTPFYVYSAAYYGHSLAGLLLFVAFYIWFAMSKSRSISRTKAFLSGYVLGYAVITEYPTALIALLIGIYILYVVRKERKMMDFRLFGSLLLGVAIPAGVLMLYNERVFGNPVAIGYTHESLGVFRAAEGTGVMGIGMPNLRILFYMSFHTTMGVFVQSPVLFTAFPGWIAMWRTREYRAEALLSGSVILLYFVLLSGYYDWWGGLAFTPRHVVPALPFFGVPIAFLIGRVRKAAFVLAIFSVGQMLVVVATRYAGLERITIAYSQGIFYKMFQNSTIYSVYVPNFIAGKLVPNLGQGLFGLTGHASLIPLVAIEASLFIFCILATRNGKGRPRP